MSPSLVMHIWETFFTVRGLSDPLAPNIHKFGGSILHPVHSKAFIFVTSDKRSTKKSRLAKHLCILAVLGKNLGSGKFGVPAVIISKVLYFLDN